MLVPSSVATPYLETIQGNSEPRVYGQFLQLPAQRVLTCPLFAALPDILDSRYSIISMKFRPERME